MYSVWDNTLRTVLVAVYQSIPTLEAGGNTVLEAPSCQMNRNWPYWYHNWLYRHRNWPHQYHNCHIGTLQYDFCRKSISIRVYAVAAMHWVFFGFSFQRIQNQYIFEPCEIPTLFPFINFSCEGSFFFGQSSKHLLADRLRCEHRRFCTATSVKLVSYILADIGPHGKLLTKQTSFLVQPNERLARITLRNFTSLFSPATILLASIHNMHISARN